MPMKVWAYVVALVVASCAPRAAAPSGRIVVVLTVDWEGAELSPEELDGLDELRATLPAAAVTHFVSAAYFTKAKPDPAAAALLIRGIHPGDEVAVHLHAWRSLAQASGITPRLSPSYLSGTQNLMEPHDGDLGFDVDLDAYSVPELRALLRTSRRLLEQVHRPVSTSFRAGGYLGTPKVLQALGQEGFTVDSSAIDFRQLGPAEDDFLPKRIAALWPNVTAEAQPWLLPDHDRMLEMPLAAIADHATTDQLVALFDAAHTRWRSAPARDQFIVLGFHAETAGELAERFGQAVAKLRTHGQLADVMLFATVENAAARALRQSVTAQK